MSNGLSEKRQKPENGPKWKLRRELFFRFLTFFGQTVRHRELVHLPKLISMTFWACLSFIRSSMTNFMFFEKSSKFRKRFWIFFPNLFYELLKSLSFMTLLKTILKKSASFLNDDPVFSNWFFHNFEKIKF